MAKSGDQLEHPVSRAHHLLINCIHVEGPARMGEYAYWIWIKATPTQVWRTYVDPTRIPEWQTGRPVIGDVHGDPGQPGSTYVSRRGRLAARTTVVASEVPIRLVTETDAYLGLHLEVTSRLSEEAGGTKLCLTAKSHWPRGRRMLGGLVDRAVLSPREADKELKKLKTVIERHAHRDAIADPDV